MIAIIGELTMIEIFFNPYIWLILALIFNIGHMLFHVVVYHGYNAKHVGIYDGIIGYLGALSVMILVYLDRSTVPLPITIALPIGFILFLVGGIILVKAQIDFGKYTKKMTLIDKGIYRYIKHPIYLGAAISFIGITIGSCSYLGLATVWLWVLLIAICGYLEERKLRKDLPKGKYDEYAKKTWI